MASSSVRHHASGISRAGGVAPSGALTPRSGADAPRGVRAVVARLAPGLAAVAVVVAAAFGVGALLGVLSPLIGAVLVGAAAAPALRRLERGRASSAPGIACAAGALLRTGIALLGLRISLGDLGSLGAAGLAIAAGTLTATLLATLVLAPRLRVERDLALLIGAGTAICGASAIAAMQPLTRAREEDVGYAVAIVTILGTVAMLAVPAAGPALGLGPHATALWAGASIHEVAQVAGAGAAISAAGLKLATLVKLGRVTLLAPSVALVSTVRGGGGRGRVPGFVLAFLGLVALRSVVVLPAPLLSAASLAATILLAAGLAGLGLRLHAGALLGAGPRPLALGLVSAAIASGTALGLVLALG